MLPGPGARRQEPDNPAHPDYRYYHRRSTGGYRTIRGGEGRIRAGRRGCRGYEQALTTTRGRQDTTRP